MKTVVVGMSGGVDSAVSALLLKEQGYSVIGMFMKNWEEEIDGVCPATEDFADVVRVATKLDIPYYPINFSKEYKEQVFADFLLELQKGNTPNPDILCNREIKFKLLLETAMKLGADSLATGHYAQNIFSDSQYKLTKGADLTKDQTYFIYTLNQEIMSKVLFPIGHMAKTEVRKIAKAHDLAVAEKKDSTGICFIGERNFRQFLSQHLGYKPGTFRTLDGKVVGHHQGVAYYTIGQRRGLAIGGAGDAWFAVGKDVEENIVWVVQGAMHPALFADELTAHTASWVGDIPGPFPYHCSAKIRYRQEDQPCVIEKIENGVLHVRFNVPQRAITPQQSIVFYKDSTCLGGAIIAKSGPTYYEMQKPLD
ncbi:MAG: tRNA 2-thiouridine(34) synthase MnmA [Verrucomicrobia bacterium]|nr:tRNA 2-thiouridine(34) synthase MnmA [Verrucomicrobiota bacterium]MBS0636602.1 tRNA 2-thiouridine(34) synthase MnmA [Verrucomicrobiota bacterium]